MPKKGIEEKSLQELLADVSIRIRLFRASLQSKQGSKIEGKPLTEHEMLLISLLGVLGGGSDRLNINDIHEIYQIISLTSLSNTIKTLHEKGYIEKKMPAGLRGYTIYLTEKGREKYGEVLRNNSIAFANIVEGFGLTEEHEPIMRHYFANLVTYFDTKVLRQLAPVLNNEEE